MSLRKTDASLHALARTPVPVTTPLTRIGRYQLITRLAVGGMAEVYLARHGELSGFRTLVVVKKVLPHLASNPEFIAMFLDEARIASLLDHPNVVRIYEVGKASNEYFLAMELVQGKPVASLLRRSVERQEPMAPKLAALVVAQAAAGLHHAHELTDGDGNRLGLVHRDVSPQNVLVSFEGSVKVIDFGIARALGRLTDTTSGGMKGKIGYMSPEQARGEDVDHRTDIFALGVVLWEAICGRRLFPRETEFATMRAIVYDPIPRPSAFVQTPPLLENIVMKALSRDPAMRFQSAHEMATALEKYIFQFGGASTADLATLMKTYFAEDQIKWRNTVRVALDMEEQADVTPPPVTRAELSPIQIGDTKPTTVTGAPVPPVGVTPVTPTLIGRRQQLRRLTLASVGAALAGGALFLLMSHLFGPDTAKIEPHASSAATARPMIVETPPAPRPAEPPALPPEPSNTATEEPGRTPPAGTAPNSINKKTKRRPERASGAPRSNPTAKPQDRRPNPF